LAVLVIRRRQRGKQIVFVHVAEEGLLKFDELKPAAAHDCFITENRMSLHLEAFQTTSR
jgi:hypothetical protein